MGAIVVKVCDTNYFIPRGNMLDFQIVKGNSCLDYVVLVSGIVFLMTPLGFVCFNFLL